MRWHRQGFRCYWRQKNSGLDPERSSINSNSRKLIREMQATNVGWGAPRIRDAIYGDKVQRRIKSLSIKEVVTAPRSPWKNTYCERVIGSCLRDCLDRVVELNERHLHKILREYLSYYHSCRTHLSPNKDPPESRAVEPTVMEKIVAIPRVGGLHHRYARIAA